jgi:serine/threonine protein kinase/WD40 repeat protein
MPQKQTDHACRADLRFRAQLELLVTFLFESGNYNMSAAQMSVQRTCPRCSSKVPPNAPASNCPRCLFELALTPGADGGPVFEAEAFSPVAGEQVAQGVLRYFGDYELQSELARGGMGVVYRARQISLNRPVALKMILSGQLATPAQVQRFHLEAQAAARLDHPHIVPIYEIGAHEGQHYYSMKLLEGGNVAQKIEKVKASRADGRLAPEGSSSLLDSPAASAKLVATVARAVHFAHQHGVLHRDLKPTNILLDASGQPQVADFGLAKLLAENLNVTASVAILGTPGYMAPEQASGQAGHATTAADIYSLGAILYELLAGRPPFQATTPLETMRQVIEQEPVPPSQWLCRRQPAAARSPKSKIAADLETICLKCLNKDPQKRYSSAEALAQDLERWLTGEPIQARPAGPGEKLWRWCRRNPKMASLTAAVWLLLLTVTIGSIAAAIRIARAEAKATEELRAAYLAQARAQRHSGGPGQRLDSLVAIARAAAIAPSVELRNEAIAALALPDVRFNDLWPAPQDYHICFTRDLALCAFDAGGGEVIVRRVSDGHDLTRLPSGGAAVRWIPVFSPDGWLLPVQYLDGRWLVWDISASRPVLSDLPGGSCSAFAPDGRTFWLGTTRGTLAAFSLESKSQMQELLVNEQFTHLVFQPQGRYLVGWNDSSSNAVVYATNSAQPVLTLPHAGVVGVAAWSADGQELATGSAEGPIFLWDAATGECKEVLQGHQDQVVGLGFSHAGDLLASTSWDGTFRLWDLVSLRLLVTANAGGYQTCFGPDDSHVAHACRSGELGLMEVTRSRELRWLPAGGGHGRSSYGLDISPDGRLAVAAYPYSLCLWDYTTGRLCSVLEGVMARSVMFTPDGQSVIACGASGLARWPIVRTNRENAAEFKLGQRLSIRDGLDFGRASLSADGRWVAAANQSAGSVALYELNNPTNRFAFGPHLGVDYISLSPDARWVATGTWHGWGVKVWDVPGRKLVHEFSMGGPVSVTFSPDNRWLVVGADSFHVFQTDSWRELYTVPKPDIDRVGIEAFSADSRYLAVVRNGRDIQLLEAATGRVLAVFEAPGQPLISWLRFTPDGSQLAALLWDRRILVWDLHRLRTELAAMRLDWDTPP